MPLPEILKRDYVQTIIMIGIVIGVVLVFWFGIGFVFKTEHPILAVASGSMEPVLYKGDLILIEGIENISEIQVGTKDSQTPGDIIVFDEPGRSTELIIHRAVTKIDNGDGTYSFKTWGDNNISPDWWEVDETEIVGRYLGIKIPWVGEFVLFIQPVEVKLAFFSVLAAILLLVELGPLVKKKLSSEEESQESLYK
ncbi:MAG: signal peptidase I [archaeon]|nr:signal peptidase I [Candidatus Bathyarchaeum sp.]